MIGLRFTEWVKSNFNFLNFISIIIIILLLLLKMANEQFKGFKM